jgi:hypothetical protein
MDLKDLEKQHAALKTEWLRHVERFTSGGLVIRTAGGADVTAEALHFLRTQIMKLESIDRLMARLPDDDRRQSS